MKKAKVTTRERYTLNFISREEFFWPLSGQSDNELKVIIAGVFANERTDGRVRNFDLNIFAPGAIAIVP